jgi:hypothetical protein
METIIAAAISAAVTLLVCIINNRSQNAQTRALIDYRLGQLEKKVDKHNNVVERTFILEGQMQECIHDIRDLKAYHKPTN